MLHPKTGKEVRIIETDASIWREHKTLRYGNIPSIWETVYDGRMNLKGQGTNGQGANGQGANGQGAKGPDYRILLNASVADAEEFKISKIVLVSNLDPGIKALRITNAIILEEIHLLYPHLGGRCDGTVEDAAVLMGGLLRFRKLAGVWNKRAESLGMSRQGPEPKLWWITQFFKHGKSERAAEIRKCLRENASSPLIDRILLLNEQREEFSKLPKIQEEVIGHRLTYKDIFERIYDIPDNTIVVFANADIFIDRSFKELWSLNLEDKFLALLRYEFEDEVETAKIFGPRADSQDTWIVRSDDIKRRPRSAWSGMNFQFGKMGCDNAIAMEMMRQKFLVVNPAQSIRTYHVHGSEIRNYSKTDVVDATLFHYVKPTAIHDLMPEFKVPEILELRECFQTPEGLVFDSTKMYIGSSDSAKEAWSKANIHGLMSTLEVNKALIVPWPEGAERREIYCLKYMSKILRLWSISPGEFYGYDGKGCHEVLKIFNWNRGTLPVIQRDDCLVWAKEGLALFETSDPVSKEDIVALRKYVRASLPIDKRKIVIVEGTMNSKEVLALEASLETYDVHVVYPTSSLERILDVYNGAWGIVCSDSESYWNWLLSEGAYVFETSGKGQEKGQEQEKEKGRAQEISAAAGLNHRVTSDLLESIRNAAIILDHTLPTIWMPVTLQSTSFFAHPGDSFREMVRLWQKAGYVNVREHYGTQVWWGEVGAQGVLLYDRPTNEWRLAAPPEEREWKLALFGNPKIGSAKAVPWTFWPRRPSLVEVYSPVKGWEERRAGPVFYGKTENAIQERRRRGDWASVCEEWVMVKDKEKYPFTQSEYLERLASSRFGLCLPGYGLKCHREIECMAMGCVPIVLKGVDMDSYAVPPILGLHYLLVEKPEDIPIVIGGVGRDAWESMSAACRLWWKDNASCEGSFRLTARLTSSA